MKFKGLHSVIDDHTGLCSSTYGTSLGRKLLSWLLLGAEARLVPGRVRKMMNRQEKTVAQALLSGSKVDIQTEKGTKANNYHRDDSKNSSFKCPVTHHVSGLCDLLSSLVSCNSKGDLRR